MSKDNSAFLNYLESEIKAKFDGSADSNAELKKDIGKLLVIFKDAALEASELIMNFEDIHSVEEIIETIEAYGGNQTAKKALIAVIRATK